MPSLAQRLLPFPLRIGLRRLPAILAWAATSAWRAQPRVAVESFTHVQCERATPLKRPATLYERELQEAKENNVRRAVDILGVMQLEPNEIFSWHRRLGPPLRVRGFQSGPEIHAGRLSRGVGGGLCQVSNMIYWLAAHAGMEILERHGHDLDLFADHERTAPFGCGATVYYPRLDLRFRNPFSQPVFFELALIDDRLVGRARFRKDPGARWLVEERDPSFTRRQNDIWRENSLVRLRLAADGSGSEELLSKNKSRVLYPVSGVL